jgi:transposase-like protein
MARRSPFRPPHCPNPHCDFHLDSTGWRFKKAGFFARRTKPHLVQRYRCFTCKRAFSEQTFSPTYWMKRPDLLEEVFHGEISCSGHRQMARRHGVSHTTIQAIVERLGRHCILIHETFRPRAREKLASEPVIMDGLGAFAGGQFWPVEVTDLMGAKSYYNHDFMATELRRSGRMTVQQKKRRAEYERKLGRPDPAALRKDVLELMRSTLPEEGPVELRTDEKTEYAWSLKQLQNPEIEHLTTHSKRPRTAKNPLFAVNSHHMFMRHSAGNHKRETVAFSKKIAAVIYRHAIFQVWKNLVKSASERHPGQTPAQRLGVTGKRWTVSELLAVRRFPRRYEMSARMQDYYWGRVPSRWLPGAAAVAPAHAS